jgi:SAM-dependent methyltransferase
MTIPEWTHDYFERGHAQRWGLPTPSEHVRWEAAGLWNLLQLPPASRVIDIGCGHGRHALAIAELGSEIIGLDSSVALLNRARHLAVELDVPLRLIRADMRRLPFRSGCLPAVLIMDAFGFFDDEESNEAVLQEAARTVLPGGRLVMKVVNGEPIVKGFRESDQEERDGISVVITSTLAMRPPRMTQKIRISGSQGYAEYERRQRLYRVDDLGAAFARAGLTVVGVFADPHGGRFEPTMSSAIWMIGSVSPRGYRDSA